MRDCVRVSIIQRGRSDMAFFFFFNDTATTEIYTLSLHDALPISHAIYFTLNNCSHIVSGLFVIVM